MVVANNVDRNLPGCLLSFKTSALWASIVFVMLGLNF